MANIGSSNCVKLTTTILKALTIGTTPVRPGQYTLSSLKFHTSAHLPLRNKLPFEWTCPPKESPLLKRMEPFKAIDTNAPLQSFEGCKELETASDDVKKLFSIGFAHRGKALRTVGRDLLVSVQRHRWDTGSIEAKIAFYTIKVRALQLHNKLTQLREVRGRQRLKEALEKRNKHLKHLRRWDYERFEWLLKTLNIVYTPPPRIVQRIERKRCMREVTTKLCQEIRVANLRAYKDKLQSMQADFLIEKEEKLRFIEEEEKALGLEPEVEQLRKALTPTVHPPPVASTLEKIALEIEEPLVPPLPINKNMQIKLSKKKPRYETVIDFDS